MDPLIVAPSEVITQSPQIDFQTKGVPPPSPLYLGQLDDLHMRIVAPTIAQGFQVIFAIRTLVPGGKVKTHKIPVLVNASLVTLRRNLGECFLLSVTAQLGGAATAGRGQVFCVASIVRGISGSEDFFWTLLSDYVTTNYRPTWPNTILKSPLEGPGFIRTITGTDPAAGSDLSETVPARARWRMIGLVGFLAASATAINRFVHLVIDDGSVPLYFSPAYIAQTAGLAWSYAGAPLLTTGAVVDATVPIAFPPSPIMLAGYRWRTQTTNLQVGDDWNSPTYSVEEWADF